VQATIQFAPGGDGSGFSDISSLAQLRVFADRAGEAAAPMGIALYRRPRDKDVAESGPPRLLTTGSPSR